MQLVQANGSAPAGHVLGACADIEVLLDLLTVEELRTEACATLTRCVSKVIQPHI